jgi:FkbM family methyltransferase
MWRPLHPWARFVAAYARHLPAHPAKVRLLKLLASGIPESRWIYQCAGASLRFQSPPSDFIGWEILNRDGFEPASLRLCMSLLTRHGGWFADVGAHHGLFTCAAASVGQTKVLSFEPNPSSFLSLKANVELNRFSSVQLVHAAAGADFSLLGWRQSGSGAGTTAWAHGVREGEEADFLLPAVPFHGIVQSLGWEAPTLVKMDVEGAELAALAGFDFEGQRPKFLLMEAEPFWEEKVDFMSAKGYRALGVGGRPLRAAAEQPFLEGNALFVDEGVPLPVSEVF